MCVEPPPKYVNRELNSQISIRSQDSHFSESDGAPPTSMLIWGAAYCVKKIYTWCIWQIMHTCACCCSWVRHCRTWLYEQDRVKHHTASSDKKKDMQPSTIRWLLIHTNDTCPYPVDKESNSSIISQFRVLSYFQTFHLAKTNTHRIGHEAQLLAMASKSCWPL